jgi:hypothetical protein
MADHQPAPMTKTSLQIGSKTRTSRKRNFSLVEKFAARGFLVILCVIVMIYAQVKRAPVAFTRFLSGQGAPMMTKLRII